ncbi:MAG: methyltransferase domain-containing protein [Hyphomonadaceae bacterium]|nr:methyltransferase domain-containing protein [Hyphomonadaceae bacterium]
MADSTQVLSAEESMENDELAYWKRVFEKRQASGDPYIEHLLSPTSTLAEPVRSVFLSSHAGDESARVLDVGCGPLSVLGKKCGDVSLNIVGVDPLADAYRDLMREYGVEPPHRAIKGMAEDLNRLFAADSFHFVHSRNALDHCADAPLSIQNMLRVAKPGAKVFINVCQNEAENAAYSGFHRWNFDTQGEHVVVWNPGRIVFLDDIIGNLPYSFTIRDLPNSHRKYPREIEIVIHNVDFTGVKWVRASDSVEAAFSRKHGWAILRATGPIETGFSFFVHGLKAGRVALTKAFRWYDSRSQRSVRLDDAELDQLRIGQYYATEDAAHRFVNIWAGEVLSSD